MKKRTYLFWSLFVISINWITVPVYGQNFDDPDFPFSGDPANADPVPIMDWTHAVLLLISILMFLYLRRQQK